MRYLIATLLLVSSLGASADQWVNGYTRQNGTYVNPYVRSNPNSTTFDNYSTPRELESLHRAARLSVAELQHGVQLAGFDPWDDE